MSYLTVGRIVVSIIVIILILLQERSAGAGGLFGGVGGEFYQKRRGLEKIIFVATVLAISVFAALSLLNLILK